MRSPLPLALALVAGLPAAASPQNGPNPSQVALEPCQPARSVAALCGTHEVFEDRAAAGGRRIGLYIVVLPATGETPEPDPVFYLAGGPGGVASNLAGAANQRPFRDIRAHRDLVLVDRRGTGGSHGLECDLYGTDADIQPYLDDFMPPPRVRACRLELEGIAALGLYTSPIAMDDIDEVRAALGYERVNLYGSSYGTREALEYLRRYPGRVRSALLHGVVPPRFYMPLTYPPDSERALRMTLDACAAAEPCRSAYPRLEDELQGLAEGLDTAPRRVTIDNPFTREPVTVSYTRTVLAEMLRYLLYTTSGANRLPFLVHRAHEGDWEPLIHYSVRTRRGLAGGDGVFLSVTCAQDVPFIERDDAVREAEGTLLRLYRFENQLEACAEWVAGPLPADFHAPVDADAPVLLLTGELDPVTPPRTAREAGRMLANSQVVIVPHAGHGFSGIEDGGCVAGLMSEFIATASTTLDTECLADVRRRPFALPEKP